MNRRASKIRFMDIQAVTFSSIVQIGDSRKVHPSADILAVQKSGQPPSESEFSWSQCPILQTKILPKIRGGYIEGDHFHSNDINVRNLRILGVSSSSIIQLGNVSDVHALARVKHIRLVQSNESS